MENILNDTSKFIRLGPTNKFDNTHTIEKNFCTTLKLLVEQGSLAADIVEHIRPVGSQRPRLYGLPKIHKPDVPLRPILSAIGSPQHPVATYLNTILQPVLQKYSTFCVKDSFAFADEINSTNFIIPPTLVSYDIKNLFTCIPLAETIEICANALYDDPSITPPPFSKHVFLELINFATGSIEFSFNNIMYRQTDGLGMGNPLGSILANIFVGHCEITKFGTSDVTMPLLYRRYVDDTFCMFDNKSQSIHFLQFLNSLHPSLVFTTELEQNNALPFLDVLVQKHHNKFLTTVYRKPTFTGMYQRWESFSPIKLKTNLIQTMVHRALKICSPQKLQGELNNIRSILTDNGYPLTVINAHISNKLNEYDKCPIFGPRKCPVYLRLPWLGNKSIQFSKTLNKSVSLCFYAVHLRMVYSTLTILPAIKKDVLPIQNSSNLIYKFTCNRCESGYIGKTIRRLGDRIKEHVPKPLRNNNTQNTPNINIQPTRKLRPRKQTKYTTTTIPSYARSSIGLHLLENPLCAKEYSNDSFKILSKARHGFHLDVLEAIFINNHKPILCKHKDFVYHAKLFPSFIINNCL